MAGLMIETQSQWTTVGLRPYIAPQALLQAHNKLLAVILTSLHQPRVQDNPKILDRASRPTILSLEPSQAVSMGTLLASQSLGFSSWHNIMTALLVQ